jgi:hypothetical protein
MRLYSRPALSFAMTVVAFVLCYLGARAEMIRSPRAARPAVAYVHGSDSERAYQFCLRHIADGCEP